ncbi:hypothetical protein GH714_038011 [Hevea brasiliensis]|uniref:Reverse transcriptase Ty1/copia-type domain-containing protein n=1 Tax=Hevea brasiliensis TaxID=3981 RepID=A0A6A6L8L4_HEVBR|nr:hypothetical protein GH714_038011 [Hevea brasiliensis]
MNAPSQIHLMAAKRMLRYIHGTIDHGLLYRRSIRVKLLGFSNSDWASSVENMKNTTEYVVATATVKAIRLRKVLVDLRFQQLYPIEVLCDNKSAIAMVKNPVFHGKTKHIKIKYHAIREAERESEVLLKYCITEEQTVDIFTEALQKQSLNTSDLVFVFAVTLALRRSVKSSMLSVIVCI